MGVILLLLALAAAGAQAGPPSDADVLARIEAGEIGKAETLAREVIDREASVPGVPVSRLADHLQRLAESFYGAGTRQASEAALRLFGRALSLRETRAVEEPGPLAGLLHDLSTIHFNGGDYEASETAERRALSIYESLEPPDALRAAQSRRDLGLISMAQGRLQEAASLLQESLEAIEVSAGADPAQKAAGRNYLAELYRLQGRYAEAASVLEGLVREGPAAAGGGAANDEATLFPAFLNNLAGVYRDQERFDEAETLLRRSLALRQAASPRDDAGVALATLNIAELYRAQGKLAEAEPLYAEALRLARHALGAGNAGLFEFINQSAVLFREQGRHAKAEPRFREALALIESSLGPRHPRVAQSHLDLAELLRLRGRCQEADIHYRKAVEIRAASLGPRHPDVAEALAARAGCLATMPAQRAAARWALDEAIAILGGSEAHPAAAVDALARRAELTHVSDSEGSRRDLASALRLVESMRPHRGGGEAVRAEFFGRYTPLYETMVSWEIEAGRPAQALLAAERGRARALLDQLAAAHVGDTAPLPRELADRQTAARAELAELRERMSFETSRPDVKPAERLARMETYERRLDAATRSFRELYDEARNASPAWRGASGGAGAGQPATPDEIQRDVAPASRDGAEGLLLLYELGTKESFVFVVPPAAGPIEARKLVAGRDDAAALGIAPGPLTGAALGRILSAPASGLLGHLASPPASAVAPSAPSASSPVPAVPTTRGIGGLSTGADVDLRRLHALWRVLVPAATWARVQRAGEVLVVPDGPLFLLPFEALVVRQGTDVASTRFWLDAGPPLRYAPSATFVHELKRRFGAAVADRTRARALSVSDPVYEATARTPVPAPVSSRGSSVRGAWLGSGALSRLPGTAVETRAVREALEPVADVSVLDGAAAREPAVRDALAGKRYLHIATHGLVDAERGELFAALALTPPPAGASRGDDDGFLQLFEIYDLRLDADLAVLSACGSNTGRLVSGEGVFALSRGFLVAGARRVVASQWPVDDASTAVLVGALFRGVARGQSDGGIDTARALRDAKLRVRREAAWAHPFFWAPFVLTGLE